MSIDICPDYGDSVSELTEENEKLKARIAELEGENERLQDAWFVDETICPDGSLKPKVSTLLSRIAELEEKQRWRVVANGELPEEEDEYWVWFDDKFTGIKISGYCDYSKQNGWDNTERVTHWMPLPTPPEVTE